MREDTRVLRDYYIFTIPHISVFAGAILGVLFVLEIRTELALGVFSLVYGLMLTVIHLVVYPHFRSNVVYRLGLLSSLVLFLAGLYLVSTWL